MVYVYRVFQLKQVVLLLPHHGLHQQQQWRNLVKLVQRGLIMLCSVVLLSMLALPLLSVCSTRSIQQSVWMRTCLNLKYRKLSVNWSCRVRQFVNNTYNHYCPCTWQRESICGHSMEQPPYFWAAIESVPITIKVIKALDLTASFSIDCLIKVLSSS